MDICDTKCSLGTESKDHPIMFRSDAEVDRFNDGLFRLPVQISDILFSIFSKRTIFDNYHVRVPHYV